MTDFILQKSAPYSLLPAQMLAFDEFLDENLAKGFIHPSKSPQAAPLFFFWMKNKGAACGDLKDSFIPLSHHRLPPYSSSQRKITNSKHAWTIDILTLPLFETLIHSLK